MTTWSIKRQSGAVIAEAVAVYLLEADRDKSSVWAPPPEDILTELIEVLAAAETVDSMASVIDCLAWSRSLLTNLGLQNENLAIIFEHLALSLESVQGFYGGRLADLLRRSWRQIEGQPSDAACAAWTDGGLGWIARHFLAALRGGDAALAERVVLSALDQGMAITELYDNVIAPVLREVGRLWYRGQISVGQEYFILSAIQLLMSRLTPRIGATEISRPVLVAACVAGELHELGLRMVTDQFHLQGWDTRFLGGDNSATVVAAFVDHVDADVVAISAMMITHVPAVSAQIALLRDRDTEKRRKILVGGYPFDIDPNLWRRVGADGTGADGTQAIAAANALIH